MSYVYLNGEFIKADEATVSVFDQGFLYGDGIRAGVTRRDRYLRWRDLGVLGDGQRRHRDEAHDHRDDRDDHGHDGPADEKLSH